MDYIHDLKQDRVMVGTHSATFAHMAKLAFSAEGEKWITADVRRQYDHYVKDIAAKEAAKNKIGKSKL